MSIFGRLRAARRRRGCVADVSAEPGKGCRTRRPDEAAPGSAGSAEAPAHHAGLGSEDRGAHERAAVLASIPEAAWHADLDPILVNWVSLAAMAWYGHLLSGPGMLVVTVMDDEATPEYQPGAGCAYHADLVATYDPETQIIVAVRHDDEEAIYVLGGWPPPPEAYEVADAETLGVEVQ